MNAQSSPSIDRRTLLRGSVTIAGAAIALPALASLSGCTAPASLEGRMAILAAASERIIPAGETPGAIAAKVPEYIAAVFEAHFTEEQQDDFTGGLALLDAEGFSVAPTEEQDAILTRFANAAPESAERAIFQQLHDMTLFGFYTSETATQELAYEELPGRYDGCVPFDEIGRAWLDRGV